MNFTKDTAVALIALIVAIIGCYLPVSAAVQNFGGITNYDEVDAAAMRIGTGCNNGSSSCVATRIGGMYAGTCSLIAPSFTVTASTSVYMDCVIPGLLTGDIVEAQFPATTTQSQFGWVVTQAVASSSSGFATVRVANMTGATGIIPALVASSTSYQAEHVATSVPGL